MGISQIAKRQIVTQMAKDYQSYQTRPRQSVATSSIHSSADDLGIAIKTYIMKVTKTGIQIVTFTQNPGTKKKGVEDTEYVI